MTNFVTVRRLAGALCASFALAGLALPAAAQDAEVAAARPDHACNRSDFKLILDIGHTLESPGADSARGTTEYSFNFFLTRQIERALRTAGFSKTVVMISDGKARPSL